MTDLGLSPELVRSFYGQRAYAENRVKELEHNFGADSFCMDDLHTTKAALRTVMMSYNLMVLLRLMDMQTKKGRDLQQQGSNALQ